MIAEAVVCVVKGESDVFSEDCLGFLSSVALTQDQQWYNTHSGEFYSHSL